MPLPAEFRLELATDLRRPVPRVLIGGAPVRVLKLTEAGATLVDGWVAGRPVGGGRAPGVLAARLVEAGMATPCPPLEPPSLSVSVVVPVKDDPEGLTATLRALASTAPDLPVVVVDDGSCPAVPVETTREAAGTAGAGEGSAARVTTVRRPSPGGPAAARNTGVQHLDPHTDVVVFIDAGCVPDAGWLPTLLPHFADPGLAAVAPRVRNRASPTVPAALTRYEDANSPLDLGPAGGPVLPGARVPYVPTAVLALRLSALTAVGRFDEELRFGEDVDLIWRLHERGWRVRYEPAATATHPARPDVRRWLRQRFDYGRSATPLAKRHGGAVAPLTVSPWSVAAWSMLAVGRPVPAIGLVAVTAQVLARRAGPSRLVAAELRRLAYVGNVRAGAPIGSAIRRAWLPPAVLGAALAWRLGNRRSRGSLVASGLAVLVGPGLAQWRRRPGDGCGPAAWIAWSLADDLAYQAGVWEGAREGRSVRALLPRW